MSNHSSCSFILQTLSVIPCCLIPWKIMSNPPHLLCYTAKHLESKDLLHPIKWRRPGDPAGATPRSTNIIKHLSQRKLWRELGYNFRVDVDGIQTDNYRNEEKCSRSVFDQWIKGQTARGKKDDRPRVWATVISALKESGGTDLATELKIALNNQVEEWRPKVVLTCVRRWYYIVKKNPHIYLLCRNFSH